jgi:hypothetical protein
MKWGQEADVQGILIIIVILQNGIQEIKYVPRSTFVQLSLYQVQVIRMKAMSSCPGSISAIRPQFAAICNYSQSFNERLFPMHYKQHSRLPMGFNQNMGLTRNCSKTNFSWNFRACFFV